MVFTERLRAAAFCVAIALGMCGCHGASQDTDAANAKMTYYCLESHKVVELEKQTEAPAVNPETGRKTLVPAYRDPKTGRWRPVEQAIPGPK